MDEGTVKARIAELEGRKRQLEADYNAILGAIQDCQWWLEKLKKEQAGKE